ncbi:DMT family transporter [Paracoccus suum]|uniref:DMT family transporter n=1 Tax=Paracoccus suum TaxID=2259340 RepID=A0A344PIR3_9RHOB|nr:DMT family transporter [Paracoccus suum]AXC49268.1 DMT family transporter [Paracoccus suum]
MDFKSIVMGLLFALIWAAAFTATRIVAIAFPPLTALVLRFALSGLIGVGLAMAMGQRAQFSRDEWRGILVFGLCQNALYLGLNWSAMQWVEASAASIIASMMPLIVALIGWLVLGERLRPLAIAGLITGFVGVAIIMGVRLQHGLSVPGTIMCLFAVVALAVATLSVRGAGAGRNVMMAVGLQMAVGAVALLPFALALEWGRPWVMDGSVAAALGFSILVPGLAATWIWMRLVTRIGAVRAATFHFLSPFLGVAIAAALLGERFGPSDVIGAAIIAAGIFMVQILRVPEARVAVKTAA